MVGNRLNGQKSFFLCGSSSSQNREDITKDILIKLCEQNDEVYALCGSTVFPEQSKYPQHDYKYKIAVFKYFKTRIFEGALLEKQHRCIAERINKYVFKASNTEANNYRLTQLLKGLYDSQLANNMSFFFLAKILEGLVGDVDKFPNKTIGAIGEMSIIEKKILKKVKKFLSNTNSASRIENDENANELREVVDRIIEEQHFFDFDFKDFDLDKYVELEDKTYYAKLFGELKYTDIFENYDDEIFNSNEIPVKGIYVFKPSYFDDMFLDFFLNNLINLIRQNHDNNKRIAILFYDISEDNLTRLTTGFTELQQVGIDISWVNWYLPKLAIDFDLKIVVDEYSNEEYNKLIRSYSLSRDKCDLELATKKFFVVNNTLKKDKK